MTFVGEAILAAPLESVRRRGPSGNAPLGCEHAAKMEDSRGAHVQSQRQMTDSVRLLPSAR